MSNTILNWRFGEWHFQILRDQPYVRISKNSYQTYARETDPDWAWFERL